LRDYNARPGLRGESRVARLYTAGRANSNSLFDRSSSPRRISRLSLSQLGLQGGQKILEARNLASLEVQPYPVPIRFAKKLL